MTAGEATTVPLLAASDAPGSYPVELTLTAGDTLDIGLFVVSGQLGPPTLSEDPGATLPGPLPLTTVRKEVAADARTSVYAALVVPASGVYRLRVYATATVITPGGLNVFGQVTISVRKSAPTLVVLARGFQSNRVPVSPAFSGINLTGTAGSTGVLDTVLIRNAGSGSADIKADVGGAHVTVEPRSFTLSGPTQATSATALYLRPRAGQAAGSYVDTLLLCGIPQNYWNRDVARRILLKLQIQ